MRDLKRLTPEQRRRFYVALGHFIDDLQEIEAGRQADFRPGLRVKPLTDCVWIFAQSGSVRNDGELHRWLQVNGHDDRCEHMQPTDGGVQYGSETEFG